MPIISIGNAAALIINSGVRFLTSNLIKANATVVTRALTTTEAIRKITRSFI